MKMPTIRGLIDRRVLVNFRVAPDALRQILPAPFRPQLVDGFGIAGICLIRLKHARPKGSPSLVGLTSENAAHRIAVEWDAGGKVRCGVFVPRRDTSSAFNALLGGRLFAGVYHRAHFDVSETEDKFDISMQSLDHSTRVSVKGKIASQLPQSSIFPSIVDVSNFFESGSLGYSPQNSPERYDGMELKCFSWHLEPLEVTEVESTFFNDARVFAPGSITFDNALLMRNIEHEWHCREPLNCVDC